MLHYLLPLTERYSNLEPDTVPPWKEPGFLLVFSLSLNFNNLSSIVSVCFLLQRQCGSLVQTVSSVQNCPRTFSLPLSCWRQCVCLFWARSCDGHGFLTFHTMQKQEGENSVVLTTFIENPGPLWQTCKALLEKLLLYKLVHYKWPSCSCRETRCHNGYPGHLARQENTITHWAISQDKK